MKSAMIEGNGNKRTERNCPIQKVKFYCTQFSGGYAVICAYTEFKYKFS